jgi:2-polyprenyl-3-methyl-5-hydroxy-6-metoxy-1,4-benzoquinol methylase
LGDTVEESYTKRLVELQKKPWKTALDVQRPYRWNLARHRPGRTLDIGCGIGRCLANLPAGSVGIDHNPYSIEVLKSLGLIGFSPDDFRRSEYNRTGGFDTMLLSHVLEHMTPEDGLDLIAQYRPLVKPGGLAILICPQEKGFATDDTHVTFLDCEALGSLLAASGFSGEKSYSFPFPRPVGRIFTYNESVVVGRKR